MMDQKTYNRRYRHFIKSLSRINRTKPKELYLHPLMDGVPFQDLEVAMMLCEMAIDEACNDNKKGDAQ